MFCPNCGAQNDDTVSKCAKCGQGLTPSVRPVSAPAATVTSYLVQSILVTIFCCWPLGIPAIVFAAQVNGKVGSGDIEGALESSRKAKMWCWISFGAGMLVGTIYLIAFIISMMAGINN